ncbi:MAG: hypothetical protein J1E16_05650 [Muribaculaceae bacterium]|nr:hypothetical protein [Muribaculaceae bacterium]
MNHKLTEEIGAWLATQEKDRDWEKGAIYVLKLSGNRILFNNIMRCIDRRHDVIEYQIKKYYNFRVQDLTHEQVEEMAQQVETIVKTNIPLAVEADKNRVKGKRSDHDLLPDAVKAFYVENLSILQQMRELHMKLRSLSLHNAPCPDSERFPFLKEIIKLDKKLHDNWKAYDSYAMGTPVPEQNEQNTVSNVANSEDSHELPNQNEEIAPETEEPVKDPEPEQPQSTEKEPEQKKKETKKKTGEKSKKS